MKAQDRALIKALMVDVDGVIVVHPHPSGWAYKIEEDLGLSRNLLQQEFFDKHWPDILLGRARLHDRLAPVLAEIAPHLSSESLTAYWFKEDAHLDRDLLRQLAALRDEGFEIHLATVQDHARAAYLWTDLGLRDCCDAMHYAAALGCAKPDPAFFQRIEERTGLEGTELFFIDDKVSNIDAARACGWNAALWTGRRRLLDLMAENGVPIQNLRR